MPYTLIDCTFDAHAEAILEILNDAIVNSTALYDYKPRKMENMATWFDAKKVGGFPVIGAVDDSGKLLGFASYGTFRAWPAFKYSVEHSIYVHKDARGMGLGKVLLEAIIQAAKDRDVHVLIGGIDCDNKGSIALHEKYGFKLVGTLPQIGFKFGRWLDMAFYQLILDTPSNPSDD